MRKQVMFHFLALLCTVVLLASCGQGSAPTDSTPNQIPEQKAQAVKVFDKGNIIRKEGNRWLITAYVEKNGAASIDAYWFTVNGQTVLQTSDGQNVSTDKMTIGAQVEAWHSGNVQESYPAQTVAAKIIIHEDGQKVPKDMISQAEAVQFAMQSQTGATAARAIKRASLNAENGYWKVELVRYETIDQPITIQIDARSGHIIPIPVAENRAFRLFSPQPGTKAPSTFTVEGEARVFEAAFSWTLEDGHTILAEGHEMAEEGAPAWGRFHFEVSYEKAS